MSGSLSAAVPLVPANAENRYEVTRKDLPLSCPSAGHGAVELASEGVPADR
jgi:hypothetical protein